MKRNQWVIVLVLGALVLMFWSGYTNFKRRKQEQLAQQHSQAVLVPESGGNQSVQQDVAGDEGLPNLRGKKAPDFTLHSADGKKISLSDYKGKAVLINFWATWCAPCKIEMPWFIGLRKQYADQGFEILGVSEDDSNVTRAQILKFGQQQGINYPLLMGDDAVSHKYGGIEFLPTSYFVGRNGKVVAETAGLASRAEVEANIKKALAAGGE
ncbi:MAG TPA: TlpA disulfide reductase family protein [Acidobacteriaceae bacterium]|nr:TlpA disulfide reductase family protein [Acidobacteriaceae bacterium]